MKWSRGAYAVCIVVLAAIVGCSREHHSPEARITPALPAQQNREVADTGQTLSASLNAAGAATTYEAGFTNGQLTRISEQRAGVAPKGEFDFHGARLVKYAGPTLEGDGMLALELDLQGRITRASVGERAARADEISAIRARAQLLRSHALAQRATREHESDGRSDW